MKENTALFLDRKTFLHLRFVFSFFLLPIFCFALSQASAINWFNSIIIFIALHFFIYPGSNVYNSYMDKDTGSIGGLKRPPPVTNKLFYASILFDSVGLLLCFLINWKMFFLMLVYVGVSKAYSWKNIRLKKYGFTGWLVVMLFQGGYTFLLVNMAAENLLATEWFSGKNFESMVLASLLIGGFYPLTQIYQHEEDSSRGDLTISYKLGISGTFIFSGLLFLVSSAVAWNYFDSFYNSQHFIVFISSLIPVMLYYCYWFAMALRNKIHVNYTHAMRITFISSSCMIICFSILFFLNH
jgi:1,4-dihydroxy-2-naphthoate polyprenyltransferase